MRDLIPFEFENNEIRVVLVDGEPLFLARDVATILGYENPSKAYKDHCKRLKKLSYNELLELDFHNPNPQGEFFVPEGDIYRMTARSRLAAAERFESWVFDEVIPTLRKYGRYEMDKVGGNALTRDDLIVEMAISLRDQGKRISNVEDKVEGLLSQVKKFGAVHPDYFTVRDYAKKVNCRLRDGDVFPLGRTAKAIADVDGPPAIPGVPARSGHKYHISVLEKVFDHYTKQISLL